MNRICNIAMTYVLSILCGKHSDTANYSEMFERVPFIPAMIIGTISIFISYDFQLPQSCLRVKMKAGGQTCVVHFLRQFTNDEY